jgi:hypothetical protein
VTNELLGYIKEAIAAILQCLVLFGIWKLTGEQIAGLLLAVTTIGTVALAINSNRKSGVPPTLRRKAAAAEAANIVPAEGAPPTTP